MILGELNRGSVEDEGLRAKLRFNSNPFFSCPLTVSGDLESEGPPAIVLSGKTQGIISCVLRAAAECECAMAQSVDQWRS